MSDTSTSGSTPPEGPAATAGAPTAPAADWGTASGANRGSGLARGKRVSTPAAPAAPVSNTAASGAYQPSAIQVLKTDSEYQNPFAPAPAAATPVAPVVANTPAEAPAPAFVPPAAPAPKAELNILPPAEEKRPAQSWETPAFPYEGNKPSAPATTPAAPSLAGERPLFRPVRRSDVPMLDSAPNASGKSPGIPAPPKYGGQRTQRGNGGGNRQQQRDGRPQQPRGNRRDGGNRNRPAGPQVTGSTQAPANSGQPQSADSKKPAGLFGWVKGLFGTAAPESGKPALPGAQPFAGGAGGGEPRTDGGPRRRRRRGGRGRSGGGGQGNPQGGPAGGPQTPGTPHVQSHGQGHPSHGHGGGNRRRRGGRGRSGGGGQGGQGGQGGGHRHEGGGSGIPPSA